MDRRLVPDRVPPRADLDRGARPGGVGVRATDPGPGRRRDRDRGHPHRLRDRRPAELVRVHRLCVLRAADRGLDPDRPRGLARSIILDS